MPPIKFTDVGNAPSDRQPAIKFSMPDGRSQPLPASDIVLVWVSAIVWPIFDVMFALADNPSPAFLTALPTLEAFGGFLMLQRRAHARGRGSPWPNRHAVLIFGPIALSLLLTSAISLFGLYLLET